MTSVSLHQSGKHLLAKTVLVTGGAGYIGSHCCKLLAHRGYAPVAYDNLSREHREFVKWGPLCEGDIRNGETLAEAVKEHNPAAVLHFAALAYVGESVEKPLLYFDNNIGGTVSLLKAIENTSVKYFILSSSCATYGIPGTVPITESTEQKPVNPYGYSKLACERIISDCALKTGLSYTFLRYFNAAGADPGAEIGEWHEPETHAIPLMLMAAHGQIPGFELYGDDYPTPDGTCVRDYVHVNDLALAHILALERLMKGGSSSAFNLGYGKGYSVKDLCDVVRTVSGKAFPVIIKPRRTGDPPELIADPSEAFAVLGWKPEWNNLERIVQTAWDWSRKRRRVDCGPGSGLF